MKKIIFFTILFLLLFSPAALGHSGLSSSSPANGEVVTYEVPDITLLFNTEIEQTSILKVINEEGTEVPIEELLINEKEMFGRFAEPLEEGEYTVNWKIIGADGHPIENNFSFRVELQEEAIDSEPPTAPIENNHGDMSTHETNEENLEEVEVKASKNSENIIYSVIILLVLIAIGTTYWLLRKE